MSRSIQRRMSNLEKQVSGTVAAPQYPPIPSLAEQKRMSLRELQELYDRVRRGEYSRNPSDVESRKAIDWKGTSPQELAEIYAQLCQETWDEVRRVFDSE